MHKKERTRVLLSHNLTVALLLSNIWKDCELGALLLESPGDEGAMIEASLTQGVVGNLYKTNWLMHQVCELHLALVQFQCWV